MNPDGTPLFAVSTFQRVWDVAPKVDVISLDTLVAGLQRFLIKGKTKDGIDAKKDLRNWSPAYYLPGARRGGEQVIHLSCLVLDYDRGTPIAEASDCWQDSFHIVHSTWSFTPAKPKFRLILPLADPIRPEDWSRVYEWAEEKSGRVVDPTGKSLGTMFALPAVPGATTPRVAFCRNGPLLDARLEGLVDHVALPPPADLRSSEPNHFVIPIPGHASITGSYGVDMPATASSSRRNDWDDAWTGAFPWE